MTSSRRRSAPEHARRSDGRREMQQAGAGEASSTAAKPVTRPTSPPRRSSAVTERRGDPGDHGRKRTLRQRQRRPARAGRTNGSRLTRMNAGRTRAEPPGGEARASASSSTPRRSRATTPTQPSQNTSCHPAVSCPAHGVDRVAAASAGGERRPAAGRRWRRCAPTDGSGARRRPSAPSGSGWRSDASPGDADGRRRRATDR